MTKRYTCLILSLLTVLLVVSGCSSTKENLVYMSDVADMRHGTLALTPQPLKIRPSDELVINVSSEVPGATAAYNLPFNNTSAKTEIPEQNTVIRFQTYIVDKAGDILFPILGKIHVGGKTTAELAEYLTGRISETVENPIVRVELVNFKVQVTGEVKEPQSIDVRTERFTVLDAIAAAGDLTVQGRRDNVLLIRQEDGQVTYHRIDLNNARSWEAPYFYLQQNDVIYVEPGELRKEEQSYNEKRSFNLTLASIIVSSCSVIASLVIAFAK